MAEDKKRPMFDLAKALRPLKAEIPSLGEVDIDARTAGFLEWLEAGDKQGRWPDPQVFVRDLLRERGRTAGEGGVELDEALVGGLDGQRLEEAAERIVAASGRLFAPRQVADPKTGKLRAYREGDPDPLAPVGDEAPSALLLRIARNYLGYHQALTRRLIDELKGARGVLELARRVDPLASLLKADKLRDDVLGLSLTRKMDLLQRPALVEAAERLSKPPLLEHHRRLAEQMALYESPLSRLRDSLGGMIGLKGVEALGERGVLFNDAAAWRRSIDRFYGLTLPRNLLAGSPPAGKFADRALAEAASLLRPGFQTVAILGLQGLAGQGAAADVLRNYDEIPAPEAAAFATVLAGITLLDADGSTPEAMAEALERAWFVISGAWRWTKDQVQRAGLIAVLALLVAVHSDWVAMNPRPQDDSRIVRTVEDLTREVQGLREDARPGSEADARSPIRYVHKTAPLRIEPHREAPLIRLVYPDQLLRVVERKGDWVFAETYDYPSDAPVRGWIHRANLRRTPLS